MFFKTNECVFDFLKSNTCDVISNIYETLTINMYTCFMTDYKIKKVRK